MRKHVISFLRSPLGYIFNLLASLAGWLPTKVDQALTGWLAPLCEVFCIRDGVQDDVHPWGR